MVAEGRLRDRGDEEEFNTSFSFDIGASASSYEAQNPWEFAGESHSSCREPPPVIRAPANRSTEGSS